MARLPRLTLPDGATVELPEGEPVGAVLPPDAIAARVDGELRDLSFVPAGDARWSRSTPGSDDGLHVLRHSTAHVLAQAVCRLSPGREVRDRPADPGRLLLRLRPAGAAIGEGDLPAIEAEMREIAEADQPFVREEVTRDDALARLDGQPFKREIIESIGAAEGEVAAGDVVSLYRNDGWVDLCLGPHVPSTGRLGAFKLLDRRRVLARRRDNPMLTRIYGTAWANQEDLEAHLHRLEEAEKRDHRRLGRQLDLFSSPDELGPGLWIWHPRGGIFRKQLEDWVRDLHLERGYDLVVTPHIARSVLWETSGHLEKYRDNMYPPMEADTGDYYVKPMNCPFHVLVYKSQVRSYRDLPMRLSELGTIYRHEKAGTLHGLLRIRGGTAGRLAHHLHAGSADRRDPGGVRPHARDPSDVRLHRPRGRALDAAGRAVDRGRGDGGARHRGARPSRSRRAAWSIDVAEGEGTFYGPKVDFHFRDAIGRLWQLTTVQCDFALPERFDMEYTGDDNQRHRPVMIHRAILGTLERFSAVLIEHYAGAFPLWLAPEQLRLVPVADRHVPSARSSPRRRARRASGCTSTRRRRPSARRSGRPS